MIIDNGSKYNDQLRQLFVTDEVVEKPLNEDMRADSSIDLIVLSGGHIFDLQDEIYRREKELIVNTDVPLLGICLGAELINLAYGGKLEKKRNLDIGVRKIKIIRDDELFNGVEKTFPVYENHRNVIFNLPDELENLAESDTGVEIFRHKQKIIYGMQFHPEMFADIGVKNKMMDNLKKIVGPGK